MHINLSNALLMFLYPLIHLKDFISYVKLTAKDIAIKNVKIMLSQAIKHLILV